MRRPRLLTVAAHAAAAAEEILRAALAAHRDGRHREAAGLDLLADELLELALDDVHAAALRQMMGIPR